MSLLDNLYKRHERKGFVGQYLVAEKLNHEEFNKLEFWSDSGNTFIRANFNLIVKSFSKQVKGKCQKTRLFNNKISFFSSSFINFSDRQNVCVHFF